MNSDDLEWEPPSEADMKLIAARRERSDQISKLMSNYLLKGYKMLGSVCSSCDTILLQDRQGVKYCVACSELDSDTTKDDPVISESAAMSMAKELELASAAAATPTLLSHPGSGATSALQRSSAATTVQTPSNASSRDISHSVKPELVKTDDAANDEPTAPFLSMSSIDVQSYTTNTKSKADASVCQTNSPSFLSSSKVKITSEGVPRDSGISSSTLDDHSVNASSSDALLAASEDSVHVRRLIEKVHWASLELRSTHSIEYSLHLCQLMKTAGEAIVALRNARV